jgi:hypothetical protein
MRPRLNTGNHVYETYKNCTKIDWAVAAPAMGAHCQLLVLVAGSARVHGAEIEQQADRGSRSGRHAAGEALSDPRQASMVDRNPGEAY